MTAFRKSEFLPTDLQLNAASFYSAGGEISNIYAGARDGHECVVLDFDPHGELSQIGTVVAIKVMSPKDPLTWLSRGSGLQLERVGEWILAFEPERRGGSEKVDALVSDVLNLLEYAKAFPQNA